MYGNAKPEDFIKLDTIDFASNKQTLALSYLLRFIGVVIFGVVFIELTRLFYPDLPNSLETYFGIAINNVPAVFSVVLLMLNVALVLFLHELIHAAVYYVAQRVPPQLGWRGLTIFAAAPGHVIQRPVMITNTLAPFAVISLLGLALIYLLPLSVLPWVLIPVVANAAAAGGDFMTLVWLLKQPSDALFIDDGDVITAFESVSGKTLRTRAQNLNVNQGR